MRRESAADGGAGSRSSIWSQVGHEIPYLGGRCRMRIAVAPLRVRFCENSLQGRGRTVVKVRRRLPGALAGWGIQSFEPPPQATPGSALEGTHVVKETLCASREVRPQQAGLGNSPRTLLDELARLQSADIVLPTADDPRRELRIRCVVRPDKAQAELLVRLGLRLPQRLRPPTLPAQM